MYSNFVFLDRFLFHPHTDSNEYPIVAFSKNATIKILDLTLDNKLTFDSHISTLCQKTGKQVQVLSRLSHVLNESNKLLLLQQLCTMLL